VDSGKWFRRAGFLDVFAVFLVVKGRPMVTEATAKSVHWVKKIE